MRYALLWDSGAFNAVVWHMRWPRLHQYAVLVQDVVLYIYHEAPSVLTGEEERMPVLCLHKNRVKQSTEVCTRVFVHIPMNSFYDVREIHASL